MTTPTTPIPVWLDCDPGHDDAFAILMGAYHPSLKLLGISTVFGNGTLKSLLTAISKEKEVSVYAGASGPMGRPSMTPPADIHGDSGLDGTSLLPKPLQGPATDYSSAVDAMHAALSKTAPGTAWLVATGTLTNAAQLFLKYPDLADHLAGFSVMGGAVGEGFTDAVTGMVDGKPRIGNWTEYAEFNIFSDPEAAASLFHNPRLARKSVLVPLDVTHLVLATADVRETLLHGPEGAEEESKTQSTSDTSKGKTTLRTMLVELLFFFADTYARVFGITAGPPLHDPIAMSAVLLGTPDAIAVYDYPPGGDASRHERYDVHIVTEGTNEEAREGKAQTGRTVAKLLPPGSEGVLIPRGIDIPHFWKVIEECCERADAANAKNGRN